MGITGSGAHVDRLRKSSMVEPDYFYNGQERLNEEKFSCNGDGSPEPDLNITDIFQQVSVYFVLCYWAVFIPGGCRL